MFFPLGVNPASVLAQQASDIGASSGASKLTVKVQQRRARTPEGQFQPDNPATPENEAWQKDQAPASE